MKRQIIKITFIMFISFISGAITYAQDTTTATNLNIVLNPDSLILQELADTNSIDLNNIVLDYLYFQELVDSNFFKSSEAKYAWLIDIPDTIKYKDILNMYQVYSTQEGKYKETERAVIFQHLLAKNWKILWGKSILTYEDMTKWRKYQSSITEETLCPKELVIYNKSALRLQDSKNPDPNMLIDFNEFQDYIEIIDVKIQLN